MSTVLFNSKVQEDETPTWFAWWETAVGSGRPESLRVERGVIAPWIKWGEFLPFATDNFVKVGSFPTEEEAWAAADGMVWQDEKRFLQWR